MDASPSPAVTGPDDRDDPDDHDDHEGTVAALNADRGELASTMGIRFVEASAQRLVAVMPVPGNRQPFGLLHGGATAVLVETAGSVAATLHGRPLGRVAVGVELSVSHHRSATSGTVTCVATAVSLGRTLATYVAEVTDEGNRRIATGRLTCVLREPPGR